MAKENNLQPVEVAQITDARLGRELKATLKETAEQRKMRPEVREFIRRSLEQKARTKEKRI